MCTLIKFSFLFNISWLLKWFSILWRPGHLSFPEKLGSSSIVLHLLFFKQYCRPFMKICQPVGLSWGRPLQLMYPPSPCFGKRRGRGEKGGFVIPPLPEDPSLVGPRLSYNQHTVICGLASIKIYVSSWYMNNSKLQQRKVSIKIKNHACMWWSVMGLILISSIVIKYPESDYPYQQPILTLPWILPCLLLMGPLNAYFNNMK